MKDEKPVFQGDIVKLIHNGREVQGYVEISGRDADVEMEELSSDMKIEEHQCKIYTHPEHELIEADMSELEMLDRAVLPGDIVRRTGHVPLGTALNVKTIAKLRVLETNKIIDQVDCARLRPIVRFSEEDRVEYKGWLGMIRELQEDRLNIETEDGVVNLDEEDDNDEIDQEFRFLSIRGLYEPIPEWRRSEGEDDSGIFPGQQIMGSFGRDGSLGIGKIITIENGDAEITWVASGNPESVDCQAPKASWPYHELGLLRAPWTENVTHTEVNAPSLGSRFTLALTKSEADELNKSINKVESTFVDIEEEVTIDQIQNELVTNEKLDGLTETDFKHWTLVKLGKYEAIFYDGNAVAKFTSDKNADFVELVGELICPSECSDHEQSHDELMSRLLSEFKPEKNGQIEIISNGFIYQPKSVKEWTKRAYRAVDGNNQNELDSIQFKLQGQGHPKRKFTAGERICIEVDSVRSAVTVHWQSGEIEVVPSTVLVPALHINEHDFSPGDFVVSRNVDRDLNEYGCVVKADNAERMLEVYWSPSGDVRQVCAFDIDEHQDYKHIRIGELVVYSNTGNVDLTHKGVSGVGMVQSVNEQGLLNVKWTDGTTTQCPPGHVISEHLLFGDQFDQGNAETYDMDDQEDLDADDWESCDSDSSSSGIDVKEINEQIIKDMETSEKMPEEMREKLLQYGRGELTGDEAKSFFSDIVREHLNDDSDELKADITSENEKLIDENQEQLAEILQKDENYNCPENAEKNDKNALLQEDMPDPTHSYLNKSTQNLKRCYLKIYQSEVKRLNTALPKGIHIRTYESRVDLLSWLIEGPRDTPYFNCLFSFDACLKPDHPLQAPKVSYKSMINKKINPNLYEDGTVCLSLLGTWSGKEDSEEWNVNSNLLQLVVSIQGMVLTASPYYNEAGYDKQIGTFSGETNSKNYNELVLVRLCEHVSASIRNPPAPFKSFYHNFYFNQGRLQQFINGLKNVINGDPEIKYSIVPISKGCKFSLESQISHLEELAATKGETHTSPMV